MNQVEWCYGREEKFMQGFVEVKTPCGGPSFRWIIVNQILTK